MHGIEDLVLECIRAITLAVLILYLLIRGPKTRFANFPGTRLIMTGFGLILMATVLDITDEIPGLERFVVIGDSPVEAVLEKIFGYVLGFVVVLIGFVRIIPAIARFETIEHNLRESEEKFRTVYETIPDVISITRLKDGLIVDLNPAINEVTDIPREQFLGKTSLDLKFWNNPADRERMVRGILEHRAIRNMEAQINTGSGQLRDCLVSARLMLLQGEPHILGVFKDITERKEVMRALQDSETRFRLIFELSPDPLIIARADGGGIIEVNRAFVVETGIPMEQVRGKTSSELNLWADPAQRAEFFALFQREGAVFNLEARFRMKDDEIRTGLISAQLVELGGIPSVLIDIRDITRQKQAETALLEMDRMKSEFISTAAHELRTPLATILGYTELLRDPGTFGGFSDEQRAEFLDEIYLKGETLSRIIDEMLDISRIEGNHPIALDRQPHEPRSLMAKVTRRFELQSGKHLFQLDFSGRQPPALFCDLHRLTQVFENLLSNAVKYSPRGGTIMIRGETVDEDYVISVADQGIGMTPEQQARVFDKFYRADSSNTAISGLGLGMSIARQIIEVHGGRIWVESEAGKGTTVTFSLPLVFAATG